MFDTLIGNEPVKEIFTRLVKNGRVPNSLLLAGDEGVGKKRFALEAARSLICPAAESGRACGACRICRRAATYELPNSDDRDAHRQVIFSKHPDIGLIIPYKRFILVDAVRDLEKEANFRPFQARARFFIIDDAERMNEAASNALLKTLEEPPSTSYIFLITARPDRLLRTIRSRCQTIRFSPVGAEEIEKHLLEDGDYAPADARLIAKLARGSIGRALEFDLQEFRRRRDEMLQVLKSLLITGNRALLLQTAEQMNHPKQKDAYEPKLEILQMLIHDLWSLRCGRPTAELINADIAAELVRPARDADPARLARWLEEIETLRENLNINLNRKIAADALFMRMATTGDG